MPVNSQQENKIHMEDENNDSDYKDKQSFQTLSVVSEEQEISVLFPASTASLTCKYYKYSFKTKNVITHHAKLQDLSIHLM